MRVCCPLHPERPHRGHLEHRRPRRAGESRPVDLRAPRQTQRAHARRAVPVPHPPLLHLRPPCRHVNAVHRLHQHRQRTRMVRGDSHHTRIFRMVRGDSGAHSANAESIGAHRLVHGGVHAHLHRQRPHRVLMPHVEHKPERLARVKEDVGYRAKRDSHLRSNTRGVRARRGAGNSARCASQGSRRERPWRESALQSGTPQSASTLLREANASKPVSRTAKSACAAGSAAHRGPR